MATTQTGTDRWKALDFGPPASGEAEPDQPVLVDYVADGHVAVITLNRPHADNAITTEMGARLTEILETIAVRTVGPGRDHHRRRRRARSRSAATCASART